MKQNLLNLLPLFINEDEAMQFAFNSNMLAVGKCCPNRECLGTLQLIKDSSERTGYRVKCDKCGTKRSIFFNSIFNRAKLEVHQILHLIYYWSQRASIQTTEHETGISKMTISSFFIILRDSASDWNEKHFAQIGGEGTIVEIDESQYSKRKSNAGRIVPNSDVWLFGGICRNTKECFVVPVADRTHETLMPLIQKYIAPGTHIISDCWRAYAMIEEYGYEHSTVNHSLNFIDPITGAHTQNIERLWREVKKSKKQYNGVPDDQIDSHIGEFMWRTRAGVNLDNAFWKAIEMIREGCYI
jgi:transposase-like protein